MLYLIPLFNPSECRSIPHLRSGGILDYLINFSLQSGRSSTTKGLIKKSDL